MEIDLNTLLQGKATIIKNKEYLSTEAYITPFLERMSKFTDNFIVQAKLPNQISITKKEDLNLEDTVFNRVWIQAVLPDEYAFENHKESINLLYALDTRKPIVKIFRNTINNACLNLCVWNPSFMNVQELEPEQPINYKSLNYLMELTDNTKEMLTRLSETEVKYDAVAINEMLGSWIRNSIKLSYDNGYGKIKLSASSMIDAYKLLYEDKDSDYYVNPGDSTSMFNIYNAHTYITSHNEKDIVNPFEKTYLIGKILSILN